MPDTQWKEIRERAAAELSEGDGLRLLFPALAGIKDSGHSFTLMPFGTLYRLAERAIEAQRSKRTLAESGLPLRGRMIIGVGREDIFVWSASRRWAYGRWRMGRLLGQVPVSQVVSAEAPTIGQGWRTVNLQLAGKSSVALRAPSAVADEFVQLLKKAD